MSLLNLMLLHLWSLLTVVSVTDHKCILFQYSKGFISHFYDISEHVTPVLAWGFLGPSDSFKELCLFFKVGYLSIEVRVTAYL